MSIVQQIPITTPEGQTLATAKKYCPHNLRVKPRLATLTVTANGTYPIPEGYAGFGEIIVNVSASGIACSHENSETVVLREPDCNEAGTARVTCHDCGAVHSQLLPRLSHRYEEQVVAPTCESGGYTAHTCTLCGHSYTDSETARLGHLWDDPVADERFSSGYSITCRRCGVTEEATV